MSTIINPLSEALKLKPAANRQRMNEENKEYRKQQLRDSYRAKNASNAQIEYWEGLPNTERSEKSPWEVLSTENEENKFFLEKGASTAQIEYWRGLNSFVRKPILPWEVVLPPTPPSSPPPKFKPTPPPYPRGKRPQVTGEDPINPTLGGGKKTRRKRSNLKQKSRMANKKNKSKRNRRK